MQMIENRCVRTVTFILILAIFACSTPAGTGSHQSYSGALKFPAQIVQLTDNSCLWIDGTLTSGSFFDGLERTDREGVFEYRNSGRPFSEYPESLTAAIRILNDQCGPVLPRSDSVVAGAGMRTFAFQVAWKTGLQTRPAVLSAAGVQCAGFLGSDASPVPPMTCQIRVKGSGVPLSDHLIVSVFGANGERLTRLSVSP